MERSKILKSASALFIVGGLAAILGFAGTSRFDKAETTAYVAFGLSTVLYQKGVEARERELNNYLLEN